MGRKNDDEYGFLYDPAIAAKIVDAWDTLDQGTTITGKCRICDRTLSMLRSGFIVCANCDNPNGTLPKADGHQ